MRGRQPKRKPTRAIKWTVKPKPDGAVQWNDGAPTSAHKPARPTRYMMPRAIKLDLAPALVIGGAMVARFDLGLARDKGVYEFAPLERYRGAPGGCSIPRGSLLMYTGMVRCTERKRIKGKKLKLQVMKHTFITPLGRCIVHNLNLLGPA
jgi:hypothetical protein